ncbi:membrane-bound lytic murein transglycosylase B [Nocardioides thalensis]|uniref:Membrane-bound lytic murein transglycosylase B n=1 Tax=Nocardioides thalensis TaxID=1914755 RepID=A0A853C445_9ACTN|nr:hypothetical protein [Nocardioides thalensis]NYJ01462.1 membrane-bound lytic murein transglycosylase B [Nocardioides thalensis]
MPRRQRIARTVRSVPSLVRRPAVAAPLAVLVATGAMVAAASAAMTGNPTPAAADADAPATTAALADELPELPAEAPDLVEPAAATLAAYADYAQAADDIPDAALVAYQRAASVMAQAAPECNLEWSLLAAIGRIASDHGGSTVAAAVLADGGGNALADTDGGALDGDATHDVPVGPLALLPATWTVVAVDGDNDGNRDADDLDDAALAAGVVLCGNDRDLTRDADYRDALRMFNTAPRYPAVVARLAAAYEQQLGADGEPGTLLAMAPTVPSASTTTATEHSPGPDGTPDASDTRSADPSPDDPGDDTDVTSYPSEATAKPTGKPTEDPTTADPTTEDPTTEDPDCDEADDEATDDGADDEPTPSVSLTPCTSPATLPTASSMPSTGGPSR